MPRIALRIYIDVVLFLSLKGARNCSIVGAVFWPVFELFEICFLVEELESVIEGFRRRAFVAHDEQTQAASFRATWLHNRGTPFIV